MDRHLLHSVSHILQPTRLLAGFFFPSFFLARLLADASTHTLQRCRQFLINKFYFERLKNNFNNFNLLKKAVRKQLSRSRSVGVRTAGGMPFQKQASLCMHDGLDFNYDVLRDEATEMMEVREQSFVPLHFFFKKSGLTCDSPSYRMHRRQQCASHSSLLAMCGIHILLSHCKSTHTFLLCYALFIVSTLLHKK